MSPSSIYFTSVAAIAEDFAVIGGHLYIEETSPTKTRFFVCSGGEWFQFFDFDDVVYALAKAPNVTPGFRDNLFVMGRTGLFREVAQGKQAEDYQLNISGAGYLMDLQSINGALFACGVQNIVYKKSAMQWSRLDGHIFNEIGLVVDRSLEAIDGFSDDDVYAVGLNGAIWHWNGDLWTSIESPTNLPLYCLKCASDGDVYIGGGGGLLLKGNKEGWTDLTNPTISDKSFQQITEFAGKIYIAAIDKLISVTGHQMVEVNVPV